MKSIKSLKPTNHHFFFFFCLFVVHFDIDCADVVDQEQQCATTKPIENQAVMQMDGMIPVQVSSGGEKVSRSRILQFLLLVQYSQCESVMIQKQIDTSREHEDFAEEERLLREIQGTITLNEVVKRTKLSLTLVLDGFFPFSSIVQILRTRNVHCSLRYWIRPKSWTKREGMKLNVCFHY
jgi:hypothetical protein